MDYQKLIHAIVDDIVNKPDALLIRELPQENDKNVSILVVAENEDCARLIGKKGCVANALRDVVTIAGKLEGKRVHIKFESFDQEDSESK